MNLVQNEPLTPEHLEITKLKIQVEKFQLGHDRYEKLRLLKPIEYQEIFCTNIRENLNFDALIDALDKKNMSVPDAIGIVRLTKGKKVASAGF